MADTNRLPLCVDCDGTLIKTDLLYESLFGMFKQSFWNLFLVPIWLLRGKSYVKSQIATRVYLDVSTLPYNNELIEFIAQERRRGRRTLLVTASDFRYANAISEHLGLFDEVIASDGETNLAGSAKAQCLSDRFGADFCYVANAKPDLAIWQIASKAVLVDASADVAKKARKIANVEREFFVPKPGLMTFVKAIRLHQWSKNVLIFVPLLADHSVFDIELLYRALLAFVAFGMCASSVYILNDLLDLESDRKHPTKKGRAFASGAIPLTHGICMIPPLLVIAFVVGSFLPTLFLGILALYYALTLSYSVFLKNRVIVDVIVLSILYTLRIVAGAAATGIVPSFWLLAFSMSIFLSLALVKRYSELSGELDPDRKAPGRGYRANDLPVLISLGASSGYMAVLVLALYINSNDVLENYAVPELLWLILPPALFWISRVWMKTHRGEMYDDPVIFALRDVPSLVIGLFVIVVMSVASIGLFVQCGTEICLPFV